MYIVACSGGWNINYYNGICPIIYQPSEPYVHFYKYIWFRVWIFVEPTRH